MESGFELFTIFAEHGHVFPKVQPVAKFGDGAVPLRNFADGGRSEEPMCKGVFAHASAGQREKLEQAPPSEEVQIDCVKAGGGFGARGLLAIANPAILDAGQSLAVDVGCSLGGRLLSEDIGVVGGDCGEDGRRDQQPPCGESVPLKRPPGEQQRCDDEQEAQISEGAMPLFKLRDGSLASLLALSIFFGLR